MKKVTLFGIILTTSFIGFAISLYTLSVTYQAQSTSNYMSDMMRQMMGEMGGMGVPEPVEVPIYLWILPPVFVGLLILGVGGLIYFLLVPEIRVSSQPVVEPAGRTSMPAFRGEKVSTLLNTMKPDEKKVFEVLASHGGKYLQKHISKETDLSRLKTHRIIARFAERGIVTVRPYGNTNEVALSDWLTSEE
ncbi:MAG: helix-turn-helix transcriptional regulator [Nitrososphaerales archaeon]